MVGNWLESLPRWIDAGGPPYTVALGGVAFVIALPMFVLVHELGHAVVGLVHTEGLVRLRIGRGPGWLRGRLGRLEFELSPIPALGGIAGSAVIFARLSSRERVLYALAGPGAEALLLVLAFPVLQRSDGRLHAILLAAWFWAALQIMWNFIPRRIGDNLSDGRVILDAIRARPVDPALGPLAGTGGDEFMEELADTWSRWIVRMTKPRSIRTSRRERILQAAAVALGLPTDPGGPAATAEWFALAGWCWRDCERGDLSPLRTEVDTIYRSAAQRGLVGGLLIANVASLLAAGKTELGLGSPGLTETERNAFFTRAFQQVAHPAEFPALSKWQRWFAFRYGVAVHDVEQFVESQRIATVA